MRLARDAVSRHATAPAQSTQQIERGRLPGGSSNGKPFHASQARKVCAYAPTRLPLRTQRERPSPAVVAGLADRHTRHTRALSAMRRARTVARGVYVNGTPSARFSACRLLARALARLSVELLGTALVAELVLRNESALQHALEDATRRRSRGRSTPAATSSRRRGAPRPAAVGRALDRAVAMHLAPASLCT